MSFANPVPSFSPLASVPGLSEVTDSPTSAIVPTPPPTVQSEEQSERVQSSESSQPEQVTAADEPQTATITAIQDPRYSRFFRMVQVGVPPQAVKLKMQSEGLDPNILDNPGASSAPLKTSATANSDSSSNASESD